MCRVYALKDAQGHFRLRLELWCWMLFWGSHASFPNVSRQTCVSQNRLRTEGRLLVNYLARCGVKQISACNLEPSRPLTACLSVPSPSTFTCPLAVTQQVPPRPPGSFHRQRERRTLSLHLSLSLCFSVFLLHSLYPTVCLYFSLSFCLVSQEVYRVISHNVAL